MFKTEQRSYNKKNVKKMGFHQHHSQHPAPTFPEDLTDTMFSALRTATFKNTIKRLSGFATLKCGHYMASSSKPINPRPSVVRTSQVTMILPTIHTAPSIGGRPSASRWRRRKEHTPPTYIRCFPPSLGAARRLEVIRVISVLDIDSEFLIAAPKDGGKHLM